MTRRRLPSAVNRRKKCLGLRPSHLAMPTWCRRSWAHTGSAPPHLLRSDLRRRLPWPAAFTARRQLPELSNHRHYRPFVSRTAVHPASRATRLSSHKVTKIRLGRLGREHAYLYSIRVYRLRLSGLNIARGCGWQPSPDDRLATGLGHGNATSRGRWHKQRHRRGSEPSEWQR